MAERTMAEHRALSNALAERAGIWEGIPIQLEDLSLRLSPGHPMTGFFAENDSTEPTIEIVVGGPTHDDGRPEVLVNSWYSRQHNARVYVYRQGDRYFAATRARSPDQSMDRLRFWLQTIGASEAWDEAAEHQARKTLREMLSERQWRHYDLTGSFFETSPRSNLTYLFRRLRPTVVMSPRQRPGSMGEESMRCIAVLCLHPLGYYAGTWAGCMVPSDDIITHLNWMRADEARYWGVANNHESWRPEAGL